MVVTRGEGEWGIIKKVKRVKYMFTEETRLRVVSTQWENIQMMYCKTVHWKLK